MSEEVHEPLRVDEFVISADAPDRNEAKRIDARIRWIIRERFDKRGVADGGWSTLYSDRETGLLWELWFPHGERHGGGPAELRVISPEVARSKYALD